MSAFSVTGERPMLYIAGGLTKASDENLEIYGDIREGCNAAGYDSYLPHEDTGSRKDNLDPRRVYGANIGAIDRSVGVVADVNVASHGVGMEIQHAFDRGIPVIALAHAQSDVSRMLLGHPGLVDGVVRYARRSQVSSLVSTALNSRLRAIGTPRGRLISVEGPDFVGKSTLLNALVGGLEEDFPNRVSVVTDPPWKLPPWGELNTLLRSANELSPEAEALLFGTARVDSYLRSIRPALEMGHVVICDRFIDSWFAYQSVRLSVQGRENALEFLMSQQRHLEHEGVIAPPGLTLVLMASTDELLRRGESRATKDKYEAGSFQTRVIDAYETLVERQPFRMVRIETTGRSPGEVHHLALQMARAYLAEAIGEA